MLKLKFFFNFQNLGFINLFLKYYFFFVKLITRQIDSFAKLLYELIRDVVITGFHACRQTVKLE